MKYFRGYILNAQLVKENEDVCGVIFNKGNHIQLNLEYVSSIETRTQIEFSKDLNNLGESSYEVYTMNNGTVFNIYPKDYRKDI